MQSPEDFQKLLKLPSIFPLLDSLFENYCIKDIAKLKFEDETDFLSNFTDLTTDRAEKKIGKEADENDKDYTTVYVKRMSAFFFHQKGAPVALAKILTGK